jgi:hypothetical protein
MKPMERLVMHAGKVSGMSLEQVNGMLEASGLDPVTEGNWRFVNRYVSLTSRDPSALRALTFGAIPLSKVPRTEGAFKRRFRTVSGGKK